MPLIFCKFYEQKCKLLLYIHTYILVECALNFKDCQWIGMVRLTLFFMLVARAVGAVGMEYAPKGL